MRKLTLVVSMLFSAVTIAGAQGTAPSDTTVVADVRNKAETVSSVAVTTTNTQPAPVRSGFGKRVAKRGAVKAPPATQSRTTTTVSTASSQKSGSAPVVTKVKTETEFPGVSDDSIVRAQTPAPEADFSDVSDNGPKVPSKEPVASVSAPKDAAKASASVVTTASRVHTGKPFARKTDHLGLVNAVRTCDRKVLYVRCDDLVDEFNRVIGKKMGRHFSDRDEIANFLMDAYEDSCPVGEMANLSRVLGTRVRAKDYWPRKFRPGERCLYVDNLLILSLDCSNPAKSTHYLRAPKPQPSASARTEPKPKVVFIPPPEPLGTVTTPEYKKKGWSTTKKVVVGGIIVAALAETACLIDDDLCLLKINIHQSQKQSQQ